MNIIYYIYFNISISQLKYYYEYPINIIIINISTINIIN